MSHTVVLPALGESVTEGTVTRWLVEVGDTIEVDAPLVEVSTDKVDTEVPSPVAGVVEQILVPSCSGSGCWLRFRYRGPAARTGRVRDRGHRDPLAEGSWRAG